MLSARSVTGMALIVVAILAIIVVSPFITILALNALGLAIPYSFGTWLAIFWLHIVVAGRGARDS